jgi:hypothetical protein
MIEKRKYSVDVRDEEMSLKKENLVVDCVIQITDIFQCVELNARVLIH